MNEPAVDPKIAAASRRVAGISALRQIRQLVDAEMAEENAKARWAKRISVAAIVGGIVAVSWTINAILR